MFEQSLIAERRTRQPWTFVLAILFQFGLVGLAVLIPLLIVEPPPLEGLVSVLLAPPPPPPPPAAPPPPAIRMVVKTPPRQFVAGKLFEPPSIPRHVAIIKDVAPPPLPSAIGIEGGVVGGVPGGQIDGLLAGILKPVQVVPPPPPVRTPSPPEAPKLLRVGGEVEEARLLHEVVPQYPPLARFARLQGAVQFDAVIGTDGKVEHLKVVGGPPLLIPAAMQAVRRWVYKPFLLNGEPVAVETQITIKFVLG